MGLNPSIRGRSIAFSSQSEFSFLLNILNKKNPHSKESSDQNEDWLAKKELNLCTLGKLSFNFYVRSSRYYQPKMLPFGKQVVMSVL